VSGCAVMDELKAKCLACRSCLIGGSDIGGKPLNVFSNMNHKARIMVVGQNPGLDEVMMGEPFVGISGKIFDEAMKAIGMSRKDMYISNIVKCYTLNNRKPYSSEIECCRKFLDMEMEIVKPEVVVALGGYAFKQMTGMTGIMKHHGEVVFSPRYSVQVMPIFHPSPSSMNNPEKKKMFQSDLLALKRFVEGELDG